jgi:hypothetical protein
MDMHCNCGHADCDLCGEFSDVGRSAAMRVVVWLVIVIASILFWAGVAWVVFK